MPLNDAVHKVTERIRILPTAYIQRMVRAACAGPARSHFSCGNLALACAGGPEADKTHRTGSAAGSIGIVTAYNDMLTTHQPFEGLPALIREAAREAGGTAQVAGGVPAMCDGVTGGEPVMEFSLFGRDVIALATGVTLSHNCFDAVTLSASATRSFPACDRGSHLRLHPGDLRAGGADDLGPVKRREGRCAPALRPRRDRPR